MKRIFGVLLFSIVFCCKAYALSNTNFFNVVMTGLPANLKVSLCLDGDGPLSCQIYTITSTTLTISTTIPNHTYPKIGIKVLTPGYTMSGCTVNSNGYCIFSASNTSPATTTITPSATVDYWVATNGSDAASGDYGHPFLTIQHARDVVRASALRGINTLNVNIRGGTYRFSQALALDSGDSGANLAPVVYRAAPNETPIISGAKQITGWTLHDAGLNIWQAQASVSTTTMPRQLYINGVRAIRAQSPAFPNYYQPNANGYQYIYVGATPPIPPTWGNPSAVEFVTATQWKMMRCPVDHVDLAQNIVMQTPCWTNANVYPSPWNFYLLSWIENAYELLTQPGQFYMDPSTQMVYYIPRVGEDMTTADVELPVLQTLIQGTGTTAGPISYINFQGLTFSYATWFDPNSANGYVSDQSGFHLNGGGHSANTIGHDPNVVRTPGNVSFIYAQHIQFNNNVFQHLGAIGLDFDTGGQNNQIVNNTFQDISAAGIQLGGVSVQDHHPGLAAQFTQDNFISNNLIQNIGVEFYDAPGIYIGVTTRSTVTHNEIQNVPWAGIAIGWGWGLLDSDGFPGLPHATYYEWGVFNTPSAAHGNQILNNKIENFLEQLWDGGAIYTTGYQGTSLADGQLIQGNVAEDKRVLAGGNTYYTDGGSRYVTVNQNVSLNNPQGYADFGPCLLSSSFPGGLCLLTDILPYGTDMGGCIPYGDLVFENNYFRDSVNFYNICTNAPVASFPVNISYLGNVAVTGGNQVPASILNNAGRV